MRFCIFILFDTFEFTDVFCLGVGFEGEGPEVSVELVEEAVGMFLFTVFF